MKYLIALIFASLSATVHAENFNYLCKACMFPTIAGNDGSDGCEVVGNEYPLRVDDNQNVLEWRSRKYKIKVNENCGKYGWLAEGNGTSFAFCTATQGYGAIEDKDGITRVRCYLKRR